LFDSRHRFNLTTNMDLPFGKGQRFLNRRGWVDHVVGGWSFNAVGSLFSGRPFQAALSLWPSS